ncbi:phosphoribosylanthranilate isomerase [Ponticaulis sp.]|uniref:phosphoribosylanthranilate isomerase n=1 Tax=Ponticaulis sp. TaxID=2020902 RepID=UPI000B7171E1|nr:phosphoribosylanthranilate isomerase [Ponticaulis sp.]MAI89322.1 N-(5'-phosphoribosyl)anthranilate isomerase [Ponticaulis sp.]OUY01302.1 MAG: N-(5'-phosphoribosyl)anthranilate isomerase [Hyphomonadaceae bacterium TMED5]
MVRTRVKICCISSVDEAQLAVRAGADAIGLVGKMPSGPGPIPDAKIKEIARHAPPGVSCFLLTSETSASGVAEHLLRTGASTVQLVQHISLAETLSLDRVLLSTRRVQVIHMEDEGALELISKYEDHVHAFLLDSGRPSAETPELGGTGRTHDWDLSRRFVESTKKPVFLAGGLIPENVGEAIARVKPYGVDVCSGVRSNGHLDPKKLDAFMTAIRHADRRR